MLIKFKCPHSEHPILINISAVIGIEPDKDDKGKTSWVHTKMDVGTAWYRVAETTTEIHNRFENMTREALLASRLRP